jgi:hypothetical protein
MRRLIFFGVLLTVLLAAVTSSAKQCSLSTLKGSFVAFEQGEIVVAAPPVFDVGPFNLTAIATYDGAGHFSGTYFASANGDIRTGTFSGTYVVLPDCTYADDFTAIVPLAIGNLPVPLHHKGFISGAGILQEIHYIYTDPGTAVSGTAKR